MKKVILYGKHSVQSALENNKRKILQIFISDKSPDIFLSLAKKRNVKIKLVDKEQLNKISKTNNHQGIAAECESIFQQFDINTCKAQNAIIALDQITDIQNIGAIIRSAYAFGINKILIPGTNFPDEVGGISKLSAGCVDRIDIQITSNLARSLEILKKEGFWIIGLDAHCDNSINKFEFPEKTVIIFGSEGKGMRHLTKKHCDYLVQIPMKKGAESLNVSASAAITLYKYFSQNI